MSEEEGEDKPPPPVHLTQLYSVITIKLIKVQGVLYWNSVLKGKRFAINFHEKGVEVGWVWWSVRKDKSEGQSLNNQQ